MGGVCTINALNYIIMDDNKKYNKIYQDVGPYLGLGFQLAASIVIMLFIGYWLDGKLSLYPLLTILFALFGGAAGLYSVIKTVLELNKKKK